MAAGAVVVGLTIPCPRERHHASHRSLWNHVCWVLFRFLWGYCSLPIVSLRLLLSGSFLSIVDTS